MEACAKLLATDGFTDAAIALIKEALPVQLRETAYALAREIVTADGHASQEQLQLLEGLRYDIENDPVATATIKCGARACHTRPGPLGRGPQLSAGAPHRLFTNVSLTQHANRSILRSDIAPQTLACAATAA